MSNKLSGAFTEKDYIRAELGDRITNLLARISQHTKNIDFDNVEFNSLYKEIKKILVVHPEWKDNANSFLPVGAIPF